MAGSVLSVAYHLLRLCPIMAFRLCSTLFLKLHVYTKLMFNLVLLPATHFEVVYFHKHLALEAFQVCIHRANEMWHTGTQYSHGEQPRIHPIVDSHGRDRDTSLRATVRHPPSRRGHNAYRHLHDAIQRIHAVQRAALHWHANHWECRHRGNHSRQVRRASCARDDCAQTP